MTTMLKLTLGRIAKAMRPTLHRNYSDTHINALRTYAKTEYGADWIYALNHMLENDGKGPDSQTPIKLETLTK
jgi:hypothetical protein